VSTWDYLNDSSRPVLREAHLVDGHRHRIHVGAFRGTAPLGPEPFRIYQLRRTPAQGVGTTGRRLLGCNGSRTQIPGDPRQSNIRKTSATFFRDEDISLRRIKYRCLRTGREIVPLSSPRGRVPCYGDTEDRMRRPPTATELNEEGHKMEHSTYKFQRIGLAVFGILQELDDVPVVHPWRYHGVFAFVHHDPDQRQYVRVRHALPRYDLSAKVLQTVRPDREGNRSRHLTFFTFWISSGSQYRITLIATARSSSYMPGQTSEKPPDETAQSPSFWTLDSGMIYELGRIQCSPQIFTSPRKHRLLVRRFIPKRGSNIYRPLV
jgi:hypothetical protein